MADRRSAGPKLSRRAVVATLQLYVHTQTAIWRLVSSDYRPLFLAGFNLVVLLAVGIGVAQVVRRLG